jgi:hypothetical protein
MTQYCSVRCNYPADILPRLLPVFTATISAEPPWHGMQCSRGSDGCVRNSGFGCTVYAINLSADFRSSFCLCRRMYRTTHSSLTVVMKNPRLLNTVFLNSIFYSVFLNPAMFSGLKSRYCSCSYISSDCSEV